MTLKSKSLKYICSLLGIEDGRRLTGVEKRMQRIISVLNFD